MSESESFDDGARSVGVPRIAELTMKLPNTSRKYTPEEKQQLLANLDIEVAHKIRQFEAWLADALENFRIHQEGLISRIPKQVRSMTIREFQKYGGDVQAALRGLQREKLGGGPEGGEIDKLTRKRKWVASQEAEGDASGPRAVGSEAESSKAPKNARMTEAKIKPGSSTGPGTAQRARLLGSTNKTPRATRAATHLASTTTTYSPSPQKTRSAFGTFGRPPSRPTSPSKLGASSQHPNTTPSRPNRPPSSATFNPVLPPKTPAYPNPRLPRLNESMLSLNGSPLANPYELGLGWFTAGSAAEEEDQGNLDDQGSGKGKKKGKGKARTKDAPNGKPVEKTLKRVKSILIRRDPSFALNSTGMTNGFHSRTNSQASIATSQSTNHSRTNSETQSHPPTSQLPQSDATPRPPAHAPSHLMHPASALVAITTKDGHMLEFDPLQTSPSALDALEGITGSAKKQAREEMGRLVQAAVDKWRI